MKNEDNPVELFIDKGLNPARIVGHSKTDYRQANPGNVVVFNANVMSKSFGKFWHGAKSIGLMQKNVKYCCQLNGYYIV